MAVSCSAFTRGQNRQMQTLIFGYICSKHSSVRISQQQNDILEKYSQLMQVKVDAMFTVGLKIQEV